jgi:hypothetical protein
MIMHARSSEPELFDGVAPVGDAYFIAPYGLFARQKIRSMVGRKLTVSAQSIEESQFQPAGLDSSSGVLADRADALCGATSVSNYQGQGLKLSKHFRPFGEG